MSTLLLFWLTFGILIVASFSAVAGRSFSEFSVHELEEYCQRRQRKQWFSRIVELRKRLNVGAEFLRVICSAFAVATGVFWYVQAVDLNLSLSNTVHCLTWAAVAGGMALVAMFFNGWVPYAVSEVIAVPFVYHTWRFWWVVSMLALPAIFGGEVLSTIFQRASGAVTNHDAEEEWLEDEIRSIVSEGERDGLLETGEALMIEGVMQLDEKDVCSVMTPRSRIDALEVDSDWDSAVRFVVSSGRTRIPVYEEKIDNIIGILYAKDLLRESLLPVDRRMPLRRLVRPHMIVPDSKMLDEMLRQFLATHTHLAVIVDEYGGVAGIVTIEDILEEIVGEIEDESDDEKPAMITMVDTSRLTAQGGAHIAVVNKTLGVELPDEDDFDTIAGLIMSRTREVPRVGTELRFDNVKLRVQRATRRTIDRVEVEVLRENNGRKPSEIAQDEAIT